MSTIDSKSKDCDGGNPRISVVIGTRAQLIKMAPVMVEMEERKLEYAFILTGQHGLTMEDLLKEFGIKTLPTPLFKSQEITGVLQMALWFPRAVKRLVTAGGGLSRRKKSAQDVVLVHGDTASTLIGAIAGRILGARVAHVEAGLRSFKALDPFPEELTRILVGRLSKIAFTPGDWASNNLSSKKCEIVNTGANTLIDAVRFAVKNVEETDPTDGPAYCVVTIHRFETLISKSRLTWLVSEIAALQDRFEVLFVLHPATLRKLKAYGLYEELAAMEHVKLRDRMTYVPFIQLLRESWFVITDGGSNQEELAYMGKPVLILRHSTERKDGLGTGAELCGFDGEHFRRFVEKIEKPTVINRIKGLEHQPSRMIVDRLFQHSQDFN